MFIYVILITAFTIQVISNENGDYVTTFARRYMCHKQQSVTSQAYNKNTL